MHLDPCFFRFVTESIPQGSPSWVALIGTAPFSKSLGLELWAMIAGRMVFAIANVHGALTVDVLVLVLQTERDRKTYSRLPQASRGIGVCYRSRWSCLDVPGRAFPTSRYSSMPTGSQISVCLLVGSEKDDTRSLGVAFQLDGVCGHFQDVPQGPQGTTRGGAVPVPPQRTKHRHGEEGRRDCQRSPREAHGNQ